MSAMVDPALKEQLLEIFELLPPRQQRQAVEYVHGLQVEIAPEESEERYADYVRREIAAGIADLEAGRSFSQEEIEALYPES